MASFLKWLSGAALSKAFGDGFAADVAGRGVVYLADNVRESLDKDDEQLTHVRLRPGERYTVIARPPATRAERKLAARQRALAQRERRATRPTRKQLKAARKLSRSQRRLDRARPGSRKERKRLAVEHRRAVRFDAVTTPSRKQARLTAQLAQANAELDVARAASFERARQQRRRSPRRARTIVYD